MVDTYGGLNVAHRNAGIEGETDTLTKQTEGNWHQLIDINLNSVWLCMKYKLPELSADGGRCNRQHFVGRGSCGRRQDAVRRKQNGGIGLTKVAATQCEVKNVRVNAVYPCVIDSAMVQRAADEDLEMVEQFVRCSCSIG